MPHALKSATRFLGLALAVPFALLAASCDVPPAEEPAPGAQTAPSQEANIRVVSWVAGPDGTTKPVEFRLTYDDYRAMHEARHNRGKAAGKEIAVRQQPLTLVGTHGEGCSGGGCDFGGCGDDRTTWVYNKPNGWNVAPGDASTLVVGCFGAGGGSWLGTANLTDFFIPPGFTQSWKAGLNSMWTSNTDKVGLVQVSGGVSVVSTFQPWTLHNLSPNTFDKIRHCTTSSSCLF